MKWSAKSILMRMVWKKNWFQEMCLWVMEWVSDSKIEQQQAIMILHGKIEKSSFKIWSIDLLASYLATNISHIISILISAEHSVNAIKNTWQSVKIIATAFLLHLCDWNQVAKVSVKNWAYQSLSEDFAAASTLLIFTIRFPDTWFTQFKKSIFWRAISYKS